MVCILLPAICLAILRDLWKMHAALHTIGGAEKLRGKRTCDRRETGRSLIHPAPPSPERSARLGTDSSVHTAAFIPGPSLLAPACQIVSLSGFMWLLSLVILA